jgi:hypothetical protein
VLVEVCNYDTSRHNAVRLCLNPGETPMSIASEILNLRRDQSSSAKTLMALLDWE